MAMFISGSSTSTGSFGEGFIDSNLTVGGIITAQEFHTEFVSASIVFQSGSTQFGNSTDDLHRFTGSLSSNGDITIMHTNGDPALWVRNSSTSQNSKIHIGEANTTAYGVTMRYEGNLGNFFIDNHYNHATRPHMYFRMRTAGTPITAMTIDPDGQVGIGTASPGSFHGSYNNLVVGTGTGDNGITIYGAGSGIAFADGTSGAATYAGTITYNHGVDKFYIGGSGNTQQVTIQGSNGNLGIGETSPAEKLDVAGNIRIDNAGYIDTGATSYEVKIGDNSTTTQYGWLSVKGALDGTTGLRVYPRDEAASISTYAHFSYNGASDYTMIGTASDKDSIVIKTSGNVGIGTTSPGRLLDVRTSSNASYPVMIRGNIDNDGGYTGIVFGYENNTSQYLKAAIHVEGTSGNVDPEMHFLIRTGGTTENASLSDAKLSIINNGKVGIGTTSPGTFLTVHGGNSEQSALFNRTGASGGDHMIILNTDAVLNNRNQILFTSITNGGNGGYGEGWSWSAKGTGAIGVKTTNVSGNVLKSEMYFNINSGNTKKEAMIIKDTGNVGIGTTSPGGSLEVDQSSNGWDGGIWIRSADDSNYAILHQENGSGLWFGMDSSAKMVILNGGNVGINDTTPSYKLDVNGTGRFTTDLTVDNRIAINATPDAFLTIKTDSDGSNLVQLLDHDGNGLMRIRDSSAAALINLYDGGVDKVALDADGVSYFNGGNVGIGTASPNQALHVAGNIEATGSLIICRDSTYNNKWTIQQTHTAAGNYGSLFFTPTLSTAGIFIRNSSDTDIFTILGSGNVGIGDSTPSYKLDVAGTGRFSSLYLTGTSNWIAQNYRVVSKELVLSFSNGTANQKADIYWTGAFWGKLKVSVTSTYSNQNAPGIVEKTYYLGLNANNSVHANSSHYTQVGGVTPGNFALGPVTWDSTNSRYRIQVVHRVSTGNTAVVTIEAYAGHSDGQTVAKGMQFSSVYTSDTTSFSIPYVNLVAHDGTAAIDGNIGISTHTPAYKLDIDGDIRSTGAAYFNNYVRTDKIRPTGTGGIEISNSQGNIVAYIAPRGSGAAASGIRITDNFNMMFGSDNDYSIAYNSTRDTLEFVNGVDFAATRMVIDSDGNVGIGETAPDGKLHILGDSGAGSVTANSAADDLIVEAQNAGITIMSLDGGDSSLIWGSASDNIGVQAKWNYDANAFRFRTSRSGAKMVFGGGDSANVLTVDGTNVGIGTESPSSKLEIAFSRGTTLPTTYDVTHANSSAPLSDGELVIKNTANNEVGSFSSLFFYAGQQSATPSLAGVGKITLRKSSAANYVSETGFWTRKSDGDLNQNMVIDSDGKVGIGVTSPANLLQVGDHVHVTSAGLVGIGLAAPETDLHIAAASPAVRFTDENVSNLKHQIIGGGDAGLEYSADFNNVAAGYHRWDISGAEKMRLIEAGYLGIGTTSPIRALDIKATGDPGIRLESAAQSADVITLRNADGRVGFGRDAITTLTSGKVGIATTSPGAILDARATAASSWLALHTHGQNKFFTSTTDGSELRFQFDAGGASDPASMNLYGADGSTVAVHFDAGDDSYFNGGNLGISTTSPVTALDVHSRGTENAATFGMADDGNAYIVTRVGEVQNRVSGYMFMVGSAAIDGWGSTNTQAGITSTVLNSGGALQGDLKFLTNKGDSLTESLRITGGSSGIISGSATSTGSFGKIVGDGYDVTTRSYLHFGRDKVINTDTTTKMKTIAGAQNGEGYLMPRAGKITALSVQGDELVTIGSQDNFQFQVYKNSSYIGSPYFVNVDEGASGRGYSVFTTPASFAAGDRLTVACVSVVDSGGDMDDIAVLLEILT